jgi:DNA polymerase III subunit gamma/tau
MDSISSTSSLATRYRPVKFSEVVGSRSEVTRLKGIITSKKIPNAIMIIGPSGVGKTTLARMFSYYLNCDTLNRCGKCVSCTTPFETHPDIREINAAETRGIDDIRNLIQHAKYKPRFKFRVIIADEMQGLTPQAFSALLKPTEDPPGHTVWIFCTTNPEKIPSTLLGRCTIFNLKMPTPEEISERLKILCEKEEEEKLANNQELLLKIAEAGGGSVRSAISLLENAIQYVSGLSKDKKGEDLLNLVTANVLKGTTEDEDRIAVKILYAIYKGSPAGVHASIADSENLFGLANKLIQLNMYALDSLFVKERNRNVWHTPLNRNFVSLVNKKLDNFIQESHTNLLYRIQMVLNELKSQMSSFILPERSLMTSTLALLALEIKRGIKQK